MLSSISWPQFLLFLLVANAIYYLFIWIFYYKAKLPVLSGIAQFRQPSLHPEDLPDEVVTTVQHVITELRPLFPGKQNRNELMLALQRQLSKYSNWEEPGFRDLVNRFIASESESICSIRLREDDLRALWK